MFMPPPLPPQPPSALSNIFKLSTKTKLNEKRKFEKMTLNWTKLSSSDIKGTIWENIDDSKVSSIQIDFLEIFSKYKPEVEDQEKNFLP